MIIVISPRYRENATIQELEQLHKRVCYKPIHPSEMTAEEKKKAQDALMFLTEKRDKTVKGRMVFNGKPTREWMSKEESASSTASNEGITLTAIVDAKEERNVMSLDIPNAFIQAEIPKGKGEEKIIMKITGKLVDYLLLIAPEVYGGYVVYENGKRVLYVEVLRALYGMLISALLWYKCFRSDLEKIQIQSVWSVYCELYGERETKHNSFPRRWLEE